MNEDETSFVIPLEPPFITPLYNGERVALRVTEEHARLLTRGRGFKGTVTDLDTGIRYDLFGAPCSIERCFCDAALVDIPPVTDKYVA
jgi:hypothetical protein